MKFYNRFLGLVFTEVRNASWSNFVPSLVQSYIYSLFNRPKSYVERLSASEESFALQHTLKFSHVCCKSGLPKQVYNA
jgi:cell shape-determining protein MreC